MSVDGSTEAGDSYISFFPDIYYNVSILPDVFPHLIGRYFNACNEIDNRNSMRQSNIALE